MIFPYEPAEIEPFDAVPGLPCADSFDTPGVPVEVDSGDVPEVRFGAGGYSGVYDGVPDCWFSSDGYVYAPDGTRIGAC
ncbi:hypothetical protein AB0K60_36360 [Thermopolyspora sp. NPDC052614]|uniref:hypothetical protein n=1 Tax=Thermopolyspora sp. NPDC052614 TaxID=3155682 RepID=UPI0034145274